MNKKTLTFLFVISARALVVGMATCFVLACAPAELHAQIEFADLQAGYEENLANLRQPGMRIKYHLEQTKFAEALDAWSARDLKFYKTMLDSDEFTSEEKTQIDNQIDQIGATKHVKTAFKNYFDLFLDSNGVGIRIFQDDDNSNGTFKFSDSIEPFDELLKGFDLESFYWSKEKNITSVASYSNSVKHFGIIENGLEALETAKFNAPGTLQRFNICSFIPNVPVPVSEYDPVEGVFVSAGSLVYDWSPPGGKKTETKLLEDGQCELKIKTNWSKLDPYKGVSHAVLLIARIDIERGFLPVSIRIGNCYLVEEDGTEYSNEDIGVWNEIECVISELEGNFYISQMISKDTGVVLDYPSPITREFVETPSNRLLYTYREGRKGNVGTKVMIQLTKMVATNFDKWESKSAKVFSPEAPKDASYSNTLTGETRMGEGQLETLKLDLDAGERPLRSDFSAEGPASKNGTIGMKFLFWGVICVVGIGMIWISRKWNSARKPDDF